MAEVQVIVSSTLVLTIPTTAMQSKILEAVLPELVAWLLKDAEEGLQVVVRKVADGSALGWSGGCSVREV